MKRAVIYLRTSSDRQIDNTSIPSQETICRAYCEREQLIVVSVVKKEAVSAKESNIQRAIELLNFVKKNKTKFDVLVVYKLDRFARSQEQHHWLRGQLFKLGIILRSATERIDESPSGKLIEGVLAAVNEYDNKIRAERVKLSQKRRLEEGFWPWTPPLGYYRPKIPGVRLANCEWDLNCAKEIIRIFELYSTGFYTFSSLASLFNKKLIKDYRGKTIKFSKQLIQRILNNQFYIGILKVKDYPLYQGKHKPLISISLWQKCQDLQNKKSNHSFNHRLRENPEFPLRRFTLCGYCNQPMTACFSKGKMGVRYPYYYCRNKNCIKYGKMVRKKDLHDEFYEYLKKTKPVEKYLPLFKEIFIARYKEREKEFKNDYLQKIEELERLKEEKKEIVIKGAKGIISDQTLKEILDDYEQKIILTQNSLNKNFYEGLEIESLLNKGLEIIRTLEKAWYEAPPEYKPKIQRLIYPAGVSYHYSGFSNLGINPCFALINQFVSPPSINVSPGRLELPTDALRGRCSTS